MNKKPIFNRRTYHKKTTVPKTDADSRVIGLAGNPNVGKSTVFNALTGLNQHTGNWPGKTVSNARGHYTYNNTVYTLVDMPGTYSILASSVEEEVARDYICFGGADLICIVADATCLERNLNIVLQILEITDKVVLCVNLLDEAKKKGIIIDLHKLSKTLGIPVVGTSARSGKGLDELCRCIENSCSAPKRGGYTIIYDSIIETAVAAVEADVSRLVSERINSKWLSLRLLENDSVFNSALYNFLGFELSDDKVFTENLLRAKDFLRENNVKQEQIRDLLVSKIVSESEKIYKSCVSAKDNYNERDRRLDRLFTSRTTGIPLMLLMLFIIFWLTITGANYPSQLIYDFLFMIEERLYELFAWAPLISGPLIGGMYRVLAWVVSVMLPPMAIFFPLFTLLEDLGYLPRIAFNMDKFFKKAHAHGKQALTMCMGFGCNACGVTGCRIIDSPRERLIAILTNTFVPCNGRFPTLISIITMFFTGALASGFCQSILSALILFAVILFGIAMTLFISWLLSVTWLKGMPSSFALELPPYRVPQVGKVIVRSIFDRTLFVLGRAVSVAAPAGLLIWFMANVYIGNISLLAHCSTFLDPFAKLIGLDGVILMAFILGLPANEIVMPIIIMSYMATGTITDMSSVWELRTLLVNNGWTWLTAICTMLFSLMHFPCATTCITIYKETGSLKWTAAAFAIPTIIGIIVCFTVAGTARILALV